MAGEEQQTSENTREDYISEYNNQRFTDGDWLENAGVSELIRSNLEKNADVKILHSTHRQDDLDASENKQNVLVLNNSLTHEVPNLLRETLFDIDPNGKHALGENLRQIKSDTFRVIAPVNVHTKGVKVETDDDGIAVFRDDENNIIPRFNTDGTQNLDYSNALQERALSAANHWTLAVFEVNKDALLHTQEGGDPLNSITSFSYIDPDTNDSRDEVNFKFLKDQLIKQSNSLNEGNIYNLSSNQQSDGHSCGYITANNAVKAATSDDLENGLKDSLESFQDRDKSQKLVQDAKKFFATEAEAFATEQLDRDENKYPSNSNPKPSAPAEPSNPQSANPNWKIDDLGEDTPSPSAKEDPVLSALDDSIDNLEGRIGSLSFEDLKTLRLIKAMKEGLGAKKDLVLAKSDSDKLDNTLDIISGKDKNGNSTGLVGRLENAIDSINVNSDAEIVASLFFIGKAVFDFGLDIYNSYKKNSAIDETTSKKAQEVDDNLKFLKGLQLKMLLQHKSLVENLSPESVQEVLDSSDMSPEEKDAVLKGSWEASPPPSKNPDYKDPVSVADFPSWEVQTDIDQAFTAGIPTPEANPNSPSPYANIAINKDNPLRVSDITSDSDKSDIEGLLTKDQLSRIRDGVYGLDGKKLPRDDSSLETKEKNQPAKTMTRDDSFLSLSSNDAQDKGRTK